MAALTPFPKLDLFHAFPGLIDLPPRLIGRS